MAKEVQIKSQVLPQINKNFANTNKMNKAEDSEFGKKMKLPRERYVSSEKNKIYRWTSINLEYNNIIQKYHRISQNNKFVRQYNYSTI